MTHLDANIRFHASSMVLALHSDTSHLSEPSSKNRAAGQFYPTNKGTKDLDNGTILTFYRIIKHGMGSSGESETALLCYNCKN